MVYYFDEPKFRNGRHWNAEKCVEDFGRKQWTKTACKNLGADGKAILK
jgi:hypothetical protein